MYGADHKGFLPAARVHLPPRTENYYWMEHVAPYLQRTVKVREVAEERERSVLWGCPAWVPKPNDVWNPGYGYNIRPLMPLDLWPVLDWRRSVWIEPTDGKHGRYFRLSQVPHRSERGMVGDYYQWSMDFANWSPNAPGVEALAGDNDRHGRPKRGNVNMLYYDGHVGAVAPADVIYAVCDPMGTTKKR